MTSSKVEMTLASLVSPIVDDGKHSYDSSILEVFLKKTNQPAKNKEMINLYLPNVISEILQCHHETSQFKVLSIGCGDGKMDRYIVKVIKEELQRHEKHKDTKIFARAIDPNGHSLLQYQADIERSSSDDQVTYNILQRTFQKYKQEQMPEEGESKFDVVHFIHSIYYMDPEEALTYCFDKVLHGNGHVVCIVEGYDPVVSSVVAKSIPVRLYRKPASDKTYAEELKEIAEKRGWKVNVHMQEYSMDVTEVFRDEKSEEGNMLLDFITQVKNFRAETEKEKVEEILKFIKESSQVLENGKLLVKRNDGIMIISRR